jgi:LPXTG-motif cell wall-anchored protein
VLPATATDAEWKMIVGTVLMAFALIVLARRRRRVFT